MSQNTTEKPKANLFDIRNIIGALLRHLRRGAGRSCRSRPPTRTWRRRRGERQPVGRHRPARVRGLLHRLGLPAPDRGRRGAARGGQEAVDEEATAGSTRADRLRLSRPRARPAARPARRTSRRRGSAGRATREQGGDPLGVPRRQVGVEVAQAEVVAGRAVLDPEQAYQRAHAVAEVEGDRLDRVSTSDRAVDEPLRGRTTGGGLLDRLGTCLRHLLLVVVAQLDEPVGVVHDVGYAVPPLVDEPVLVGEVRDVEVDDPRRPRHVAGVGE